jgi:hypothetical protein
MTSREPWPPGRTGSLLHFGTVHPQLADASSMIRSEFPVFVKVKLVPTTSPSAILPKSQDVFENVSTGIPFSASAGSVLLTEEPFLLISLPHETSINKSHTKANRRIFIKNYAK